MKFIAMQSDCARHDYKQFFPAHKAGSAAVPYAR
jgi:hypothetical protein